ncbi:MAG TPA: hypothetical protein ENK77_03725 [Epsilonproteobacteria bacterium]|nr:hypothetical protein [Campylobacterota bacterium]
MITSLNTILLVLALLLLGKTSIYATEGSIDQSSEVISEFSNPGQQKKPSIKDKKQTETVTLSLIKNNLQYVMITAGMYAFVLIIIIILMKMTPDHQAKDLVTIIGLVSVIFGTILLVLIVDTSETLTAPMGILGAIAGYLFGTAQKKEGSQEG